MVPKVSRELRRQPAEIKGTSVQRFSGHIPRKPFSESLDRICASAPESNSASLRSLSATCRHSAVPEKPASLHRCCLLLLLHAAPGFRALPRSTGAIASNARHLTLLLDPTTRLVSSCPLFPPSPLLLTLHTASATSTLHHPPSSPHPRCDSTSPCTFAVRSRRACNNNNTCSPTTASLRRNIPVQLPPAALSRRMRQPLARLAAQHSPHRR